MCRLAPGPAFFGSAAPVRLDAVGEARRFEPQGHHDLAKAAPRGSEDAVRAGPRGGTVAGDVVHHNVQRIPWLLAGCPGRWKA